MSTFCIQENCQIVEKTICHEPGPPQCKIKLVDKEEVNYHIFPSPSFPFLPLPSPFILLPYPLLSCSSSLYTYPITSISYFISPPPFHIFSFPPTYHFSPILTKPIPLNPQSHDPFKPLLRAPSTPPPAILRISLHFKLFTFRISNC